MPAYVVPASIFAFAVVVVAATILRSDPSGDQKVLRIIVTVATLGSILAISLALFLAQKSEL